MNPEPPDEVVLSLAFVWDCPDCHHENWQRGVTHAIDPDCEEDMECAREVLDAEPWQDVPEGLLMACPEAVTCRRCGRCFTASPG